MRCLECTKKVHARGLCSAHYMAWYKKHREVARRTGAPYRPQRKWKFTMEHWWKWWEKRTPDFKTLELRADIQAMRYGLR